MNASLSSQIYRHIPLLWLSNPGRHHKEIARATLFAFPSVRSSAGVAELVATLARHVEAALSVLDHVPASNKHASCFRSALGAEPQENHLGAFGISIDVKCIAYSTV